MSSKAYVHLKWVVKWHHSHLRHFNYAIIMSAKNTVGIVKISQ